MKEMILIAEDDQDLCYLLELHIRSKGYDAQSVQSLKEVEIFLRHEKPVMVLLDNNLHDGLGMHYIEKFKSSSPGMPIVLMTADFIQDLKQHGQYAQIDGLLLKPFTPDKLNEILDRIAC